MLMHTVVLWCLTMWFRNVVFSATLGDCIGWSRHSIGKDPGVGLLNHWIPLLQSHRAERDRDPTTYYTQRPGLCPNRRCFNMVSNHLSA